MTAKSDLKTVLDEDLEALLRAIGLLDGIRDGSVVCRHCARPMSPDEVSLILVTESGYEVVCDNPACVELARLSQPGE